MTTTLAADPALLADTYDVVIVGSGYGGAVTAARLGFANHKAGGRLRIAVLERGVEHPVGSTPESEEALLSQLRSELNPLGFYELLLNDTVDIIQGCALGGTSLNNMNAAVVPDREVFLDSWPQAFRDEVLRASDGIGGLNEHYDRARQMLGSIPYRTGKGLAKASVFDAIAERAGMTGEPVWINVNESDRETAYGVQRGGCTDCGDCCMACNVGAKNTLTSNYLPMARHFGVQLFTRVEVDRVEVTDDDAGYRLHCLKRTGAHGRRIVPHAILARRVVLAAGSLGSTAILLRSRAAGLPLPDRLGEGFSGNGDAFAVAYNTDRVTNAQGFGTGGGERASIAAGPSITSMMRFGADRPNLYERFTVQDLTPPRALVDTFRHGYPIVAGLTQPDLHPDSVARVLQDVEWNTTGAMNHSLGFLIMAHDTSDGRIVLDDDGHPQIDWPSAPSDPIYERINEILRPAVEEIGGRYLPNPLWTNEFLGNNLITAHPLGGCGTADGADEGVVDADGRVFAPGGGVYDGLRVCDGSVMPRALAVNPLLTISMFAERAADSLRSELGLPAYEAAEEADDRVPLRRKARAGRARPAPVAAAPAERSRRERRTEPATQRTNGAQDPVQQRITALRELAAVDHARAQDDLWQWIQQLGDDRDGGTLAALFALGTPPEQLDGPADGILVTTLINPLVDVPLRMISKVWSPWRGSTFDAVSGTEVQRVPMLARLAVKCVPPLLGKLEDDLVELVPDTHLGRVLVRAWGIGPARIGYIALRHPACETSRH
ncbi:MAG: cholesterol oxidase [Solirubrobacteraceae bacterium]|nr:cholesterol oxidase [Solirubrobacteraceae bacterium]